MFHDKSFVVFLCIPHPRLWIIALMNECTLKIEGVGIEDVMKGEKTVLTFPTFTTTYIQERYGHHHLST